ncbi:hypothetical protein SALBM217S_05578 [Streptomyces griseoloalbus]
MARSLHDHEYVSRSRSFALVIFVPLRSLSKAMLKYEREVPQVSDSKPTRASCVPPLLNPLPL